jgi:tetratricopeptide (TPR) repeat protein
MKCGSRKSVQVGIPSACVSRRPGWLTIPLAGTLICCSVLAQSPPPQTKQPSAAAKNNPSQPNELATRIAAAGAARESGDPVAVARANQLVIATALREMATLRSIEAAYPQAIKLYQDSLKFEDNPTTRAGLALADAQAGQYDEAIKLAQEVQASNPNDLSSLRMLASIYMQKGEAAKAIEPFSRVAAAEPTIDNLYALGNCLLQTHKPEDKLRARTVFEQMKKTAGDSGSLHVLFGRAYRDAGDMPSAIGEFRQAIAIDPRTPHAHYFLGLATLASNEWKPTPEAESEMKKEVEYYPHDYLANYMMGFLASGERRYDEAHTYLTAAAAIDPTSPDPYLYIGLDFYAQGDMRHAEEALRKAVLLTGKDEARSNYQIRRAYVDLGRILTNSGRKDDAEVFLAKARELQNKTMVQTQQSVANMALAGGAGSAAAVMPLTRQQENASDPSLQNGSDVTSGIDPATQSKMTADQRAQADEQEKVLRATLGLAYNDLATSQAIRRQYTEALGNYQEAARWDSSLAGLQKNLGLSAFRAGEYPAAIEGLAQALRQQPDSTALRAMLGISYFNLDQFTKAAETFHPLGEHGMRDGEVGYAWAASLAHTGDMKAATEVLIGFSSEPRPDSIQLLIGQLWTVIGDYARAIATFQQVLQSNPNMSKAHFYAGLAYIHWQHWPDAEKEFKAELELTPHDPDAEYHLGFVYTQQSKMDEAVALFKSVVASYPEYANAQYQLGKILLDRGQIADAVPHLEAAARLSPQTDYIHYQLQNAYRKSERPADADRELEIYKQLKSKEREHAGDSAMSTH